MYMPGDCWLLLPATFPATRMKYPRLRTLGSVTWTNASGSGLRICSGSTLLRAQSAGANPEEKRTTQQPANPGLSALDLPLSSIPSPSMILFENFGELNWPCGHARSEEHTSELQSREKLVCRLLL